MKTVLLLTLLTIAIASDVFGQNTYTINSFTNTESLNKDEKADKAILSPSIEVDDLSKNIINGMKPNVVMGFQREIASFGRPVSKVFVFPSVNFASSNISENTEERLNQLMSPWNINIDIDMGIETEWTSGLRTKLRPVNFGLKLGSGFSDSSISVTQHHINTGLAVRYQDWFVTSFQYAWGWHNISSDSESHFKEFFKKQSTDIEFIVIALQFGLGEIGKKPTFIYLEWKYFANKDDYEGFGNSRFLSLGFRNEINF